MTVARGLSTQIDIHAGHLCLSEPMPHQAFTERLLLLIGILLGMNPSRGELYFLQHWGIRLLVISWSQLHCSGSAKILVDVPYYPGSSLLFSLTQNDLKDFCSLGFDHLMAQRNVAGS